MVVSGYSILANAIKSILTDELGDGNVITICFLNAPIGKHPCLATGLLGTIETLWQQPSLAQPKPILILGFGSAMDKGHKLFQWPGAAYLPYGFTRDQLVAAARKVFEGAKQPLPPGLLPTAADVLRINAEIRHWLENRLRNAEVALSDFERAARGEIQLHRSYLEPVAAIPVEHQAMLDRLWALEAPAKQFAPQTGGLAPLKAAIAGFETHWRTLEVARAVLRSSEAQGKMESLAEMVIHLRRVREALSSAIMASRNLDGKVTAG